jgi:hypothetical protein
MPPREQRDPSQIARIPPVGPPSRPPLRRDDRTDGGFSAPATSAGRSSDWTEGLRRLERKRRGVDGTLPADYYARATWSSFRLEGIEVEPEQVREALAQTSGGHSLRSRQCQRLRNHAAILHHIETDLRQNLALSGDGVIRWYATIGAGLSTAALSQATTDRLDDIVRRINSPQLRLAAAIPEIAALHVALLADPLVPSFNGILSRLLLRYHLGRCNLPAVIFDPAVDSRPISADAMARRLIELLEITCDQLTARPA